MLKDSVPSTGISVTVGISVKSSVVIGTGLLVAGDVDWDSVVNEVTSDCALVSVKIELEVVVCCSTLVPVLD